MIQFLAALMLSTGSYAETQSSHFICKTENNVCTYSCPAGNRSKVSTLVSLDVSADHRERAGLCDRSVFEQSHEHAVETHGDSA